MSKIKIDVAGYEAFDGFLGTLQFEGGVSVREATDMEIRRIGANIKIVKVGNDEQVGPATVMVDARNVSAVVETALQKESDEPATDATELKYTEEQLIEIGSEKGIKGIREIAAEFGVKGVSIDAMIADIMEAQKKAA
jgi:hypothetical protein